MHTCFDLPAEVTIYNVTDTRGAMLTWVSEQTSPSPQGLRVSARDVTEIDGAGLQLLAAFSNMGQHWQVVDASEAFIQACRTLGFGHWLAHQERGIA